MPRLLRVCSYTGVETPISFDPPSLPPSLPRLPAVEVLLGDAELAALLPRLDGAPLAHLGRQLVVHDALEAPRGVALGRRRQARLLRVDREHRELRRAQLTCEEEGVVRV